MRIKDAKARIILNSRGEPTVEVEINGFSESVPIGASRGRNEARKIKIEDAIRLFKEELLEFLKTYDVQTFGDLKNLENDFEMIGGIKKYGANLFLAIEYAILRAWSHSYNEPVYSFFNKKPNIRGMRILANVIGGGIHARWKSTDIQEFLISPRIDDLKLSIFLSSYIHKIIGERLDVVDSNFTYGKNDEGAWTTSLKTEKVLRLLNSVGEKILDEYKIKMDIGMDIAATQLYKNDYYSFEGSKYSKYEFIDKILNFIKDYNIFYIEDPLYEEDFDGFSDINFRTDSIIAGDDLTVTNLERVKKAIEKRAVKAIIIKPDQAGSIIRTIEVIEFCKKNNIIPIFSHRSGETESNIIAHLAVAFEVPYVKFGISNGERVCKLNELLRIYEKLYE